ncbi:hypothetical protein GOBAR_DD23392 [Gossypium barbadense]|nr:hypothetical protein GOBAR_DD23392 [Gossypium barbadense]
MIYDERVLQIDELDEWRAHVKEKLKKHDEEPKRRHDEHVDGANQFKVEDEVLLDETNQQIAYSELNANRSNPFTVLNVFPCGTIEVTYSEFGTFKVNKSRLKIYFGNRIDTEKEEIRLREPS